MAVAVCLYQITECLVSWIGQGVVFGVLDRTGFLGSLVPPLPLMHKLQMCCYPFPLEI